MREGLTGIQRLYKTIMGLQIMKTVDVSVVILQKNELLHIRRCLEGLKRLNPRAVFIVDCYSSDGSDKLATELGAKVVYHEWPGNQASQFQWAIENLPIESTWILRLDADEYLTDELIDEIKGKLPQIECDVDGVVLKRRHVVGWLGNRWVKRGMYPAKILRLFRRGYGRSDMKIMDEHIIVQRKVIEFEHDFVDHSLISFEEWKEKHRNYAKREAQSYMSGERSSGEKAAKKEAYYRLPRYLRAFAYFCVRYVVKLGFLDGVVGLRWHFWHGLWYRSLVDNAIGQMKLLPKKHSHTDR